MILTNIVREMIERVCEVLPLKDLSLKSYLMMIPRLPRLSSKKDRKDRQHAESGAGGAETGAPPDVVSVNQ